MASAEQHPCFRAEKFAHQEHQTPGWQGTSQLPEPIRIASKDTSMEANIGGVRSAHLKCSIVLAIARDCRQVLVSRRWRCYLLQVTYSFQLMIEKDRVCGPRASCVEMRWSSSKQ
eukprot:6490487-Amphidinium_carterae.4